MCAHGGLANIISVKCRTVAYDRSRGHKKRYRVSEGPVCGMLRSLRTPTSAYTLRGCGGRLSTVSRRTPSAHMPLVCTAVTHAMQHARSFDCSAVCLRTHVPMRQPGFSFPQGVPFFTVR